MAGKKKYCHHFQLGQCTFGDKCRYAHEIDPKFKRPTCHAFSQTGHCARGDKCRYSHEAQQDQAESSNKGDADVDGEAARLKDSLMRWRYKIPKNEHLKNRQPTIDMQEFLQDALMLVESGAELMQEVINALATEYGLFRLDQLLRNRAIENTSTSNIRPIWTGQILPYLRILGHEKVLASRVVEATHSRLLNDLYGADGEKAIRVFSAALKCLEAFPDNIDHDMEATLAVLAGLYITNGSAHVNTQLKVVIEGFMVLAATCALSGAAHAHLQKIKIRHEFGEKIPDMDTNVRKLKFPLTMRPQFVVTPDLPGELSNQGPRHDNDKDDIREISILPTMNEIQSLRPEYLPRDDSSTWHLRGISGLIDRHFRCVREDTVGQLRDAARLELERMQNPGTQNGNIRTGARTNTYHNVHFACVHFDSQKGMQFVFIFDQPEEVRKLSAAKRSAWWDESKRLGPDALICLLDLAGSATFLTVAGETTAPPHQTGKQEAKVRTLHDKYKLADDSKVAYLITQLARPGEHEVELLMRGFTTESQRCIVEFPGVVLPAFEPTLLALQQMASNLDLPFQDLLCADGQMSELMRPAYLRQEGFRLNLQSLLPVDHPARDQQHALSRMPEVLQQSMLDSAQREAVNHALQNQLALIQGPPGTGKSFTGVKTIQMLLDNKQQAHLGPILCVCFTNHALDQLLEHLSDAGVPQIIRIGSRSKSEKLAALNLRNVVRQYDATKHEKQVRWQARKNAEEHSEAINDMLDQLSKVKSPGSIKDYLRTKHPQLHSRICDVEDEGGWRTQGKKGGVKGVQEWLNGGARHHHTRARPLTALRADQDVFAMSHAERQVLYTSWVKAMAENLVEDIDMQMQAYSEAKEALEDIRGDIDVRALSDANVIGVTTSGLARSLEHLRSLKSKVLVVEEAGELLEAHLLTALLPSLEHAILIGDHQQLRPKVQNYDLSSENPRGRANLDISLFERLVHPRNDGDPRLPYATLATQRRMHPSISQMIRSTLYPALVDAPTVHDYPEVVGMRNRLFWFDHQQQEDGKNHFQHTTSHTNTFEVKMTAALIRHLIRQGVYKPNDIAIITPYLGQLRKLRAELSSIVEIVLNDRDEDDIKQEDAAGQAENDITPPVEPTTTLTKGNLANAVRIATVDNFQGEEAKVVVVSLVRCNDQNKCGFLRTPNRINVLLSRAQHGMYIIGSSTTSSHIPMWNDVISQFRANSCLGPTLQLCCPRHTETPLEISKPEDFTAVAPEAGCAEPCTKQLKCGHACVSRCHSQAMHDNTFCFKECPRLKKGCQHPCRRPCGEPCQPRCQETVEMTVTLPCGHTMDALPCWQYQDTSTVLCKVAMDRLVPHCGHKVTLPCHVSVDSPSFACKATCGSTLGCAHNCQKQCWVCRPRQDGMVEKTDHGTCTRECGRLYSTCNHHDTTLCHGSRPCKLCTARCENACSHSRCTKSCHEACVPCAEPRCASHCVHTACKMPCGAPCDWVPCSLRCDKLLSCGCQCPSVCGEECPSAEFCQKHAGDEVRALRADLLMFEEYGNIDLDETPCLFLACGHILTAVSLDGLMGMSDHYQLDPITETPTAVLSESTPFSEKEMKTCPDCRGSLRNLARYGRIVRRALLDQSTKRFVTWSNKGCADLASRLAEEQKCLIDTKPAFRLTGTILLNRERGVQMDMLSKLPGTNGRYKSLASLRTNVRTFMRSVQKEEQPFQKVHDMVEAVRRRGSAVAQFSFDQTILQTRGYLLTSSLFIRCDLIALTDFINAWGSIAMREKPKLSINFVSNRKDCDTLASDAKKTLNLLQEAEGHIYWAQFAALELSVVYGREEDVQGLLRSMEQLKQQAIAHLTAAKKLRDENPNQISNVAHEIDAVERMIEDSTTDVEMRMVVAAMATEFSGTGHWYRCVNGHPFTIGECGMPMQLARCPQCNAAIGGQSHQAAAGVTHAHDIEREFGNMQL